MKQPRRRLTSSTGFTLIELIVVTAVIAVLAAVAMVSMLRAKNAANEASAIAFATSNPNVIYVSSTGVPPTEASMGPGGGAMVLQ